MLVSLTHTRFAREVYRLKKKEGTRNHLTLTLIPQQGSVLAQPVLGRGERAGNAEEEIQNKWCNRSCSWLTGSGRAEQQPAELLCSWSLHVQPSTS